jgi:DNA polymerase III subunit epsilon
MKKILFIDTETTGLPNWKAPSIDESQPHLVQLACQLCDEENNTYSEFCFIIDNNVNIPEEVSAIHGITTEIASEIGLSFPFAMLNFSSLYKRADMVVAHNLNFDERIMRIAMARYGVDDFRFSKEKYCTMRAATPIVNIPPTQKMLDCGLKSPKSPKLEECISFFFDEEMKNAHNAMVDVQACRRLYFHLQSLGR